MATVGDGLRVARFAALGEPVRLAIVDELYLADRAPAELGRRLGISSNLLAHHLEVLEQAGLVQRSVSAGDRRRRYVRLITEAFDGLAPTGRRPGRRVLFVSFADAARGPLAAALWTQLTGGRAASAGIEPGAQRDPRAIAAARRAGLEIWGEPSRVPTAARRPASVVTVCDRAHERLGDEDGALHWSIADPGSSAPARAFDGLVEQLRNRISAVASVAAGVAYS